MADASKIEWTDATWNPVTGCTKVSPGCDRCYAETFAERWRGTPGHHFEAGFDVTLRPERLAEPLRWRKPRRVFVNSMSDLFHDAVPDEFIARVFAVMAATPQHTYQILTKRHGRMRSFIQDDCRCGSGHAPGVHLKSAMDWASTPHSPTYIPGIEPGLYHRIEWPLPNVWLGVSAEDQRWADIRIPALLETPAAVRFVSAEPLLGPIELPDYVIAGDLDCPCEDGAECPPNLDWVIVGGESGPGARPMHPAWAQSLRDQCAAAGVPFFFKQWGAWCPPHDEFGQSIFGHVTNDDACQVVSARGELLGRPWGGWRVQDGTRDAFVMRRYPKSRAGRVLDGRTWDEMPGAVLAEAATS